MMDNKIQTHSILPGALARHLYHRQGVAGEFIASKEESAVFLARKIKNDTENVNLSAEALSGRIVPRIHRSRA